MDEATRERMQEKCWLVYEALLDAFLRRLRDPGVTLRATTMMEIQRFLQREGINLTAAKRLQMSKVFDGMRQLNTTGGENSSFSEVQYHESDPQHRELTPMDEDFEFPFTEEDYEEPESTGVNPSGAQPHPATTDEIDIESPFKD